MASCSGVADEQSLTDRQLHVVAGVVVLGPRLGDDAGVGESALELLVRHGAAELVRQVDARLLAEPEQLVPVLQHRLCPLSRNISLADAVEERVPGDGERGLDVDGPYQAGRPSA